MPAFTDLFPQFRRRPSRTRAEVLALGQKLEGILNRMEKHMNAQLSNLLKEVSETRGQNASILAFLAGIPALIQAAVDKVLAEHPDISQEDLAAITDAAAGLDTDQQAIAAAIAANPGLTPPVVPPVEPPVE